MNVNLQKSASIQPRTSPPRYIFVYSHPPDFRIYIEYVLVLHQRPVWICKDSNNVYHIPLHQIANWQARPLCPQVAWATQRLFSFGEFPESISNFILKEHGLSSHAWSRSFSETRGCGCLRRWILWRCIESWCKALSTRESFAVECYLIKRIGAVPEDRTVQTRRGWDLNNCGVQDLLCDFPSSIGARLDKIVSKDHKWAL